MNLLTKMESNSVVKLQGQLRLNKYCERCLGNILEVSNMELEENYSERQLCIAK